jgi:hypothetical protein
MVSGDALFAQQWHGWPSMSVIRSATWMAPARSTPGQCAPVYSAQKDAGTVAHIGSGTCEAAVSSSNGKPRPDARATKEKRSEGGLRRAKEHVVNVRRSCGRGEAVGHGSCDGEGAGAVVPQLDANVAGRNAGDGTACEEHVKYLEVVPLGCRVLRLQGFFHCAPVLSLTWRARARTHTARLQNAPEVQHLMLQFFLSFSFITMYQLGHVHLCICASLT